MDGALWAREGLVQLLVVTPFWASIETDMPIELWRRLAGDKVTLAAGLELLLRPYHSYRPLQFNSLETVRGAAASLLSRGADRIYLFNYMDSQTEMPDRENYPALLRECGQLATLAGKPRRHVLTYADTWAPGEAQPSQLPRSVKPDEWVAFRLDVGPSTAKTTVRLELEDAELAEVRVNGEVCRASAPVQAKPGPERGFRCWDYEKSLSGTAVVEARARTAGRIHWVEIARS